jgi:hypothetical protein
MKTPTMASLLLLVACQPVPGEEPVTTAVRALGPEDGSLEDVFGDRNNGRSLTGIAGPELFGVEYQGATLAGQVVTDVVIDGGRLLGRLPGGQPLERTAWTGAVLRGRSLDGSVVPLRIDAVEVTDAHQDLYTLSRPGPDGADGAWVPYCEPYEDGDIHAIPVPARWNPSNGDRVDTSTHFTFSCRKGAITKCLMAGYRPGLPSHSDQTMADAHQACTRILRADSCGNGRSNTLDGTPINIFDRLDPPVRPSHIDVRLFEGLWTRDGATCLSHLRWQFLRPECEIPRCDTPADAEAFAGPTSVYSESLSQTRADAPPRE